MTSAAPQLSANTLAQTLKLKELVARELPHALEAHPEMKLLMPEDLAAAGVSAEHAIALYRQRHEAIARQWAKPLYCGYEPPQWRKVDAMIAEMRTKWPAGVIKVLLSGGNRSGKSEYAGKKVVKVLTNPAKRMDPYRAWCFQGTQAMSWSEQQPIIYKNFPPDWKPGDSGRLKKGATTNITWNDKSGFGADSFVLPNHARCDFKFYASETANFEGAKLDIVWADELIPIEFIEPLEYRLAQLNGLFLLTFTPVKGYSAAYGSFVTGAKAVEEMVLEIPVVGRDGNLSHWDTVTKFNEETKVDEIVKVPVVLACKEPASAVVYFDTRQNFYGGPENVVATVMRKGSREKVIAEAKLRLYGIPRSVAGAQFDFREDWHVAKRDVVHKLLADPSQFTLVQVLDPAPGRNQFMQWWVDLPNGQMVCVREWPQEGDNIPGIGDPGAWAEVGAADADEKGKKRELADGRRGPAQQRFQFTLKRYSREILRVETELALHVKGDRRPARLEPLERNMDSRAASAPNVRADECTTLLEEYERLDEGLSLFFQPAPGGQKDAAGTDWIAIINQKLAWDEKIEGPGMLICEDCKATIFGLQNWTGNDGSTGACKDPVDCTKYKVLRPFGYVDFEGMRRRSEEADDEGGGGY